MLPPIASPGGMGASPRSAPPHRRGSECETQAELHLTHGSGCPDCPEGVRSQGRIGTAKLTRFRALLSSLRNCRFIPSRMRKFRKTPRSRLRRPGPSRMFLPAVPRRSIRWKTKRRRLEPAIAYIVPRTVGIKTRISDQVRAIGIVAIEVGVTTGAYRERRTAPQRQNAGDCPVIQQDPYRKGRAVEVVHIPNARHHKVMPAIRRCACAVEREIAVILHVRLNIALLQIHCVQRFAERVVALER